jgi:hypothetical protein
VHLYKSAADLVGTPDARELAAELASWHDAMVNHLRAVRLRNAACDEDCAHERARVLWTAAVGVFGDVATRFAFLQTYGGPADRIAVASTAVRV